MIERSMNGNNKQKTIWFQTKNYFLSLPTPKVIMVFCSIKNSDQKASAQ